MNQTPDDAPALDRPGTEITVTDRTHALFGQRLKVVFRKCPGQRDHVLVELPSGRRRAVPVAATSLADHIPGLGERAASSPALISIRTLLPLVGVVRALKRRALEVPDAAGHRSTSTDSPSTHGEDPPTPDLAPIGTRAASARSTRLGRTRPTRAPDAGRSQ